MNFLENKAYNKIFSYWLVSLITFIFLMIVVGGLTRLTDSGLSITEWELFNGILPPLTADAWEKYFTLYKEIPQYTLLNINLSLEGFKVIFYWEYAHRLLGRILGLFFLIPFGFFIYKKALTKVCVYKFSFIFLLILLQGVIGWYMVMSGLVSNVTVSHYRLAVHLTLAFIIISLIYWNFLNFNNKTDVKFFKKNNFRYIKYFIILLFFQIIFGAFVSGLDAGKIYQSWPLMNNSYFPDDTSLLNIYNIFDFNNSSVVQFFHRNIAYIIFLLSIFIGYKVLIQKNRDLIKPYLILLLFIFIQISLGILVLLSDVNMIVASFHQITSLFIVFSSLNLYHASLIQNSS